MNNITNDSYRKYNLNSKHEDLSMLNTILLNLKKKKEEISTAYTVEFTLQCQNDKTNIKKNIISARRNTYT